MKKLFLLLMLLILATVIAGCMQKTAPIVPENQEIEIDSAIQDLDMLDEELDTSDLDGLEQDLDIQI